MVDHVSREKRSQIMAAVKGRDTRPEYIVRKLLFSAGYRYRLHVKKLPGKPDIVLRKYWAVIFVHGCFWHGHGCHLSKTLPKTRKVFWRKKISSNKIRDEKTLNQLIFNGWRVCLIWECALKRQGKIEEGKLLKILSQWITARRKHLAIIGKFPQDKIKAKGQIILETEV